MQAAVDAARGAQTPAADVPQETPDKASTDEASTDEASTDEASTDEASTGTGEENPEAGSGSDGSREPITEPLPRWQAALTAYAQTAAPAEEQSPRAANGTAVWPARPGPPAPAQDRPAQDQPGRPRAALPAPPAPAPPAPAPPAPAPRAPAPAAPAPAAPAPPALTPAAPARAGLPARGKQPERKQRTAQKKRPARTRQSAQDTYQAQTGWPAEGGWPAEIGPASTETPGRPAGGKTGASRPRVVGVAAVAVVLVAAATVAAVLTSQAQAPTPTANRTAGPPATTASRAADWVASQVSHDAVVACDHRMCSALAAAGFPGRHLQRITPASPYPVHSDVVVVTPAVQHHFGSSLAADWAPAVLATFGSGSAIVTIRVVSAQGAAAYQSALNADLKLRRADGAGLLASRRITVSPQARKDLMSGQVDARLIIVLTALASLHPVKIVRFGTVFKGTSPGLPLRMADIAADDAAAKLSPPAYLRFLNTVIHEQPTQYALQTAGPMPSKGRSVYQIQFSAPSPLGFLGPQGP